MKSDLIWESFELVTSVIAVIGVIAVASELRLMRNNKVHNGAF
jgi:hypothetical protein